MNKFEVNVREGKYASFPFSMDEPEFQVSYTPIRAGIFNIYLTSEIVSATQFIPAIEVLTAATENDTVEIYLSTPGGSLDATDTFIMAMQDCAAKIVIRASGGVHSAGSIILLQADEFYLSENFNCLIHNGSCGAGGDFNKFVAQAMHTKSHMEKVMRRTYEGFLSEKEIDDLLEGKDIWLDAEAFGKRFEVRNDMLAQRANEAQQALLEQYGLAESKPAVKPKPKRAKKPVEE